MIDIGLALDQYHNETRIERPDAEHLHVLDLVDCPLAVWAKRNRPNDLMPFTPKTLRLFRKGKNIEAEIIDAVRHVSGHKHRVLTDALVVLGILPDGGLDGWALCEEGSADYIVDSEMLDARLPGGWCIGHPDIWLPDHSTVIEVKATKFWTNDYSRQPEPAKSPQYQYVIQAAAYALAVQAERAHIVTSCYASDLVSPSAAPYIFDPKKYESIIAGLIGRLAAETKKGAPEPPPDPPAYANRSNPKGGQAKNWRCEYCRYAACAKNNNPQRLEIGL